MNFVYADNFRGFSELLLPLDVNTFLVGENSTGKSSFLALLRLVYSYQFWYDPNRIFDDEAEFDGFDDMVTASTISRTNFRIGVINVTESERKDGVFYTVSMSILTFGNSDGLPKLNRVLDVVDGHVTELVWDGDDVKYSVGICESESVSLELALNACKRTIRRSIRNSSRQFLSLSKRDLGPSPYNYPYSLLFIFVDRETNRKDLAETRYRREANGRVDIRSIAPIRTKAQRYYATGKKRFSPEGEHTPNVLQQSLRLKGVSDRFRRKLQDFGRASGLFEAVEAHAFERGGRKGPFELLIQLGNLKLNMSSVGYGVSQVLPLVVEFLATEDSGLFAVQQPEVHLHPRAQAAFGELIYAMTKERTHTYVLETHSDFMIDRYRSCMSRDDEPVGAQVLFFERKKGGNKVHLIRVESSGQYSQEQPTGFRDFFVKEAIDLLGI